MQSIVGSVCLPVFNYTIYTFSSFLLLILYIFTRLLLTPLSLFSFIHSLLSLFQGTGPQHPVIEDEGQLVRIHGTAFQSSMNAIINSLVWVNFR